MKRYSTHQHRPRVRRHRYGQLTFTAIFAAVAVAILVGGCGSGGSGAASLSPSPSHSGAANPQPSSDVAVSWTAPNANVAGSLSASLESVSFVDADHGWAVGETVDGQGFFTGAVILATSDGGATWTAQDASAAGSVAKLSSVSFVNASDGWAVGEGKTDPADYYAVILVTTNGGTTWVTQNFGAAGSSFWPSSVDFVDASHGWAVGESPGSSGNPMEPVILATTDGGATWAAQDASAAGSNADLASVDFVDANDGWAVGQKSTGNGALILATTDGGATWTAQDASSAGSNWGLNSVSFVSSNDGWAVSGSVDSKGKYAGALILATTDAGGTWKAQNASAAGSTADLASVSFVDANDGWAVGNSHGSSGNPIGPVILATTDGGTTWAAQDASAAGSAAYLDSVDFVDANDGLAVGGTVNHAGPMILSTSK